MYSQGLESIGPEAKDSFPTLIDALRGPDESLRRWCPHALAAIDPAAEAAVPALIAAVKRGDDCGAILALGKIRPAVEAKRKIGRLLDGIENGTDGQEVRARLAERQRRSRS